MRHADAQKPKMEENPRLITGVQTVLEYYCVVLV